MEILKHLCVKLLTEYPNEFRADLKEICGALIEEADKNRGLLRIRGDFLQMKGRNVSKKWTMLFANGKQLFFLAVAYGERLGLSDG